MGKATHFAILLAILSDQVLCYCSLEEFYVKPTGSSKCPPGGSPCESLQYYADHSSFTTNNSKFLFLEGDHHLDSVVDIRNVANLSLLGAGSRVKIHCGSLPSGFHIERFVRLSIENITIIRCKVNSNSSVHLESGSEVSLNHINITSTVPDIYRGLTARNVVGPFTISDSSFVKYPGVGGWNIDVFFFYGPSHFEFTNNELSGGSGLIINIFCSDVEIHITHSLFKVGSYGLHLSFKAPLNHSMLVEKSDVVDTEAMNVSTTAVLDNVTFANLYYKAIVLDGAAILFANCSFENNSGSAISANNSRLIFEGNNLFRNNTGLVGGAMQLRSSSRVYLQPSAYILFENNHANYAGGAIYTDYTASDDGCFFEASSGTDHQVGFIANTASYAGSSLYGDIQGCCIRTRDCEAFRAVFNITNTEADPSAIAANPYQVCLCKDGQSQPDCSYLRGCSVEAFPGQVFSLRLAVVGAGYLSLGNDLVGTVRGAIRAFPPFSNVTLGASQASEVSGRPCCENFNYSVYGTEKYTVLLLAPEQNILKTDDDLDIMVRVNVHLKKCPVGFVLSNASSGCVCHPILESYNIWCDITEQTFLRPANSWLGFINDSSSELIVTFFPNCPNGYCTPLVINISLDTSDSQCQPNRTGLLCGKCEEGYSLTLGNGKCVECSNTFLLLLLPLALAGLLLVVVLFALNLTVTEGSINGLLFYANVLSMSNVIQFTEGSHLYAFLAWLNLDLGINTCLYDGMDGYSETWLEFLFPAYLLSIIVAIILLYRKFPALAHRIGGENAVQVIATPLLLFYTKLQRTVITIISFTRLEYSYGVVRHVWFYDANLEYFTGKHVYLGITGIIVLVFIILPYALCLTFFQQLQACSGHRLFRWVNKLKPVFDAYAGPYKDKYRFWTGMLLLVRTLLIVLFTINYAGSVEIKLLIISVVSCVLVVAQSNGIYKKWSYNFLEAFFYAQLIVFAAGAAYARHNNFSVATVADTSIGITLFVFLAVLGYHVWGRIRALKKYCHRLKGYADVEEDFPHSREIDSLS